MSSRRLSRREILATACAAAIGSGCRSHRGDVLRLGFMTNLTHAPAIAGIASGRIARAMGVPVESRSFRSGPRVVEALLGDAIDVGVAGPSAIVFAHARHGAGVLRVLSGCASGGASFVVARSSGIRGPADLRGKTLATPQLGSTQDIALRTYLRTHGYEPAERGGDVTVHALDTATVLVEMKRGALDGAWLPEPWATRVLQQAGAVRLIDERDLWPNHAFPSAIVAARGDFARDAAPMATRLAAAMGDEVDRALHSPVETREIVGAEIGRLLGRALPQALINEASRWIDFTRDPLPAALDTMANDAFSLGLSPRTTCRTLFG